MLSMDVLSALPDSLLLLLEVLGYFTMFAEDATIWAQSFTSLNADLCQDINGSFALSRCLNGTHFLEGSAPLRHWYINI